MDELLFYGAISLGVCVAILLGVVVSQRERLKGFEAKFGLSGVGLSVQLTELVKKEVARVSLASVGRMAAVDRQLIEFWERASLLSAEDSARRVGLVSAAVDELERGLAAAPAEDKYQLAIQLREMYWRQLEFARQHFASSAGYQEIRARVVQGLVSLEEMGKKNAV